MQASVAEWFEQMESIIKNKGGIDRSCECEPIHYILLGSISKNLFSFKYRIKIQHKDILMHVELKDNILLLAFNNYVARIYITNPPRSLLSCVATRLCEILPTINRPNYPYRARILYTELSDLYLLLNPVINARENVCILEASYETNMSLLVICAVITFPQD